MHARLFTLPLAITLSACTGAPLDRGVASDHAPPLDAVADEADDAAAGLDRHASAIATDGSTGPLNRELDPSLTVRIEIDGVGTFFALGLSRVGWEIEVESEPVAPGHVTHSPAAVHIPDITLQALAPGDGSSLQALQSFCSLQSIADPAARLFLEGVSSESLVVELRDVIAASCDTSTEAGRMAELVLDVSTMDLESYTPAEQVAFVGPGRGIEIEGFGSAVLSAENIAAPSAGDQGAISVLVQPSQELDGDDWIQWMQMNVDVAGYGVGMEHRTATIYDVASAADPAPVSPVTYHEAWPYRVDLFNPARPYGKSHLVDIHMVFAWSTDAP